MKRLILSLLIVIGTLTSSFSQTSYPKKILWENDTVLAITKPQLIKINRSLNDYVHLKKSYELVKLDLQASDSLVNYWKSIAEITDTLCTFHEQKFEASQKINAYLEQELKNQKKRSRKVSLGVGAGGTLLGILLGVLFIR